MSKASSNHRSAGLGSFGEKVWGLILPGLLTFALIGATWGTFLFQQTETKRAMADVEMRLSHAVKSSASRCATEWQNGSQDKLHFMLTALAKSCGGKVTLHGPRGRILLQAEGREGISRLDARLHDEAGSHVASGDQLGQVLVWAPLLDAGKNKIGELRIEAPLPVESTYPWSFWAGLLGVFGLLTAICLLMVVRLIEPVRGLADFVGTVGQEDPFELQTPEAITKDSRDLAQALDECIEGLQQRQLRSEESFVEVAVNLAREYEYHAEGSIGHGQRTRRFAAWLAERLRMEPVERDTLEVAALCHDIGRVPPAEGEPWGHDRSLEAMHAELGAAYFEAMPGLEEVANIIRYHHFDFDGTNAPDGPEGQDLPLGSRILRIADSFERHVSGRDGGRSLDFDAALALMSESRDKVFDPELFDLFCEEVAARTSTEKLFGAGFPTLMGGLGEASHN